MNNEKKATYTLWNGSTSLRPTHTHGKAWTQLWSEPLALALVQHSTPHGMTSCGAHGWQMIFVNNFPKIVIDKTPNPVLYYTHD